MGIGLLRITFGVVWAIDAWFKWRPDFIDNFAGCLTGAQQDQPASVQPRRVPDTLKTKTC